MDREQLLGNSNDEDEYITVKYLPTGQSFISGISNSYRFHDDKEIMGVLPAHQIEEVLLGLNDVLINFWPCGPCYYFGIFCAPCTLGKKSLLILKIVVNYCSPIFLLGSSLLCPNYCIGKAEYAAKNYLHDMNMVPLYFDRGIRFELVKTCCSSHVALKIPKVVVDRYRNGVIFAC